MHQIIWEENLYTLLEVNPYSRHKEKFSGI